MPIKIIGLGPGARDYILPKATKEIQSSDVVIGFQRAIESIAHIEANKKIITSLKEIGNYIDKDMKETLGIIASGDPCFYGILEYIKKQTPDKISVVPGISSFQYLMSKINKSWHNAYVGSLHGREEDFMSLATKHNVSVWLTDKTHNVNYICDRLLEENKDYQITVGENLSYKDEKITAGLASELKGIECSDLCVVVVENLDYN